MNSPSGTDALLSGVIIALYLVLLFTGRQHLEFGRYFQTFASLAGLAILAISVYLLGWPGVFILVGISLVAGLVRIATLTIRNEELLVSAQIHGAFESRHEAMIFPKKLRSSHRALRAIGRIELSKLIHQLAVRGRTAGEIEKMAAPIAMLHIVFKAELNSLVDRFDQLMRLWGFQAEEAIRTADVLTATTRTSAASFDETLDAMIAFSLEGGARSQVS